MAMDIQNDKQLCETIRVYKRRWLFLFFAVACIAMGYYKITAFGQINGIYVEYYNVTYTEVDLITIGCAVGPAVGLPIVALLNCANILPLRRLFILGTGILSISYLLELASVYASQKSFVIFVFGQVLNGLGLEIMFGSCIGLSAAWFPENEVVTAISASKIGEALGQILGSVVPVNTLSVPDTDSPAWILYDRTVCIVENAILSSVAVTSFLVVTFFFQSKPPCPPSESMALKNALINEQCWPESLVKKLKNLLKHKRYFLTAYCFAAIIGLFFIDVMIVRDILESAETGILLGKHAAPYIIIISSTSMFLGGLAIGPVMRTFSLNVVKVASFAAIVTFLARTGILVSLFYHSYIACCCFFFLFGLVYSVAVVSITNITLDQTYPINESFISNINVFGLSLVNVINMFLSRQLFTFRGYVGVSVQQMVLALSVAVIITFYNPDLKRSTAIKSEEKQPLLKK